VAFRTSSRSLASVVLTLRKKRVLPVEQISRNPYISMYTGLRGHEGHLYRTSVAVPFKTYPGALPEYYLSV
jgi:hypothetical protein